MGDRRLLPCSNCDADLFEVDAEDTTVERERDFEFQGEPATRELPAKICPKCDEVTVL